MKVRFPRELFRFCLKTYLTGEFESQQEGRRQVVYFQYLVCSCVLVIFLLYRKHPSPPELSWERES